MISLLLKRFGKFITVSMISLGVAASSLLITTLLNYIFRLELGSGGLAISFILPLIMSFPLSFLEMNTIAKLETAQVELEKLATTDPLTGVPNRGHFFTLAEDILLNAPPAQSVGLAIIDIDRFKLINDRYGHLAGDEALRSIAQAIHIHVRPGDLFGRFAGDEFILLCPNTTRTEIMELTHYLLQHVQTLSAGEDTETRLSATMGVTTAIPGMASLPELIAKADTALLKAKREGGGRVLYA